MTSDLIDLSSIKFHTKEFWDNFYKNRNKENKNINWYFDITNIKINDFSLNNLTKEDEILLIGPGLSSILDYLNDNDFDRITIIDFSEELTNILTERYNKEWIIIKEDITSIGYNFENQFDQIIDKGCLDCILADPINGENNFIKTLMSLVASLQPKDGVLYYFSDGKIEDRINLLYKIQNIKYKVSTIDTNEVMGEEYKQFNKNDNLYYLYTITRT